MGEHAAGLHHERLGPQEERHPGGVGQVDRSHSAVGKAVGGAPGDKGRAFDRQHRWLAIVEPHAAEAHLEAETLGHGYGLCITVMPTTQVIAA